MKIVIAGASGLVGSALCPALRAAGHDVRRLVRRETAAGDEISWDPAAGKLDVAALQGVDAVINLAGENVGSGRWTAARRTEIVRSRVDTTRTLVAALTQLARRPSVFVCASATGFYGDRGDDVLTEASAIGHGFLPEVCLAWETFAEGAARAGIRTVLLRFGVVLARDQGALAKMLPWFRRGLGGRMGRGQQWLSWIALADAVRAIQHVVTEARCRGPVNVVSPTPVTNAQFALGLARALNRPLLLPAPAWGLRLAFGQMADETILASTRAAPRRLEETGFVFRFPTLDNALHGALSEKGSSA